MTRQIPVTAIVPTANRSNILQRTLESLAGQRFQPVNIVIIDVSDDDSTEQVSKINYEGLTSIIELKRARAKGAAVQRNQAFDGSLEQNILFFDDDIIFEEDCIERLWNCLQSDTQIGAVNAMITNQQYHTPGKLTRFMYRLMSGENLETYAGKCIGPAWNLLPEDNSGLPEYNKMEWLNTTCTLYRKVALPVPCFDANFKGYSLMEDLALSLRVGKNWKLYNVRSAKIFHDSQPGIHKKNISSLSAMELENRYYIMVRILGRNSILDHLKLFFFELFGIIVVLVNLTGWKNLLPTLYGKFNAIVKILSSKNNYKVLY